MKNALASFFSKLAALGLLALVILGAVSGIALPLSDRYETLNGDITARRMLLGRLQQQSERLIEDTTDAVPQPVRYLPGETDAVRLAGLQSILNEAAEAQSIRLISSRSVDVAEQDGLRLLGVAAQLKAPMPALQNLLVDLENQRGALVVENLQIMRQTGDSAADLLDITLVLRGTAPAPAPTRAEQAP